MSCYKRDIMALPERPFYRVTAVGSRSSRPSAIVLPLEVEQLQNDTGIAVLTLGYNVGRYIELPRVVAELLPVLRPPDATRPSSRVQ
jgi:hypothetical protein